MTNGNAKPAREWRAAGETQRFLLLSILIGVFAGLLVVLFHITIDALGWFTREPPYGATGPLVALLPAAGALASVGLVRKVFRGAKGSGVVDTKAAIYVSDGHVPFSAVIGKFMSCAISIGTGNSLGPEDPSLHMGAGIASVLGRAFGLTRDKMRLIAPVGAAAGLAAAFNTPISPVLFIIEEILAGWSAGVLGSIVLSSVAAAVVVRWFLGNQPLFLVPAFQLTHASELLVYAGMGIVGGLLSVVFVRAVAYLRHRMESVPDRMQYVLPVLSGLAVGITGIWLPQVMGAGYSAIDGALHGRFTWQFFVILVLAKIAVTLLCFSTKTPGGMFAPALFIGAMAGGAIGGLAELYWKFPTSPASAYVLVGMGTFFAGVFRAPMTSVFMVFEVSASYVIILPVMIANTIAYLISRRLQPVPFFTLIARDEGMDLPSIEEQRDAALLRVEDAMSPAPAVLTRETPLAKAIEMTTDAPFALVAEGGGRWSAVSRTQLEGARQAGAPGRALGDAVRLEPLPYTHPDMPLDSALRVLGHHTVVPVVSRTRPRRLVGTLSLENVEETYGVSRQTGSAGLPRARP